MKKLLFLILALFACGEESDVIDATPKFIEANDQAERERDVLVAIEDVTLFAEKATEADWGNNVLEIKVDYTSSPPNSGDVVVESLPVPDEENLTGNTWGLLIDVVGVPLPATVTENQNWQSFKQKSGFKELNLVKGYFKYDSQLSFHEVKCSIWDTTKTIQYGSTIQVTVNSTTGAWETFDFSAQGIDIEHNIEYWIKLEAVAFTSILGIHGVEQRYQNANLYADGQFDRTGDNSATDLGDLMFEINFLGDYFEIAGLIRTDNIDIGEVPINEGEWVINDITSDDSTMHYVAWHSPTGAFAGEETFIGTILDGDIITDLKRYWRVETSLTPNINRDVSPILQSIKADFTTFRKMNVVKDLGYEPIVNSLSSLTTRIDFFDASTIGQISLSIVATDEILDWVASDTLFNKIVKVKVGFVFSGFVESDYIDYFRGAIDGWDIDDGILNLTLKDLSKDWKVPVPSKWESSGDDVVYIDEHHIDVILDIFQNEINVRDSGLLIQTFADLKIATPAYKVTRTITGSTEDGKKLVEELRQLLFAFFIPKGDGKIGIKRFDKDEVSVVSFTDDNTTSIKWEANSSSLKNRTNIYFNWDGDGEDEEDFSDYDEGDNSISQSDFRVTVPHTLKDKWTRPTEAVQISDLETSILDQFSNMPSRVTIKSDAKDILYEVGDMMDVTTKKAPDSGGIVDEKYLIVSKNLDWDNDSITFEGLRVEV